MKFDTNAFIEKNDCYIKLGKVMMLNVVYGVEDDYYMSSEAFTAKELLEYFNDPYIIRACKNTYNPRIYYIPVSKETIDSMNENDDSKKYVLTCHRVDEEIVDTWFIPINNFTIPSIKKEFLFTPPIISTEKKTCQTLPEKKKEEVKTKTTKIKGNIPKFTLLSENQHYHRDPKYYPFGHTKKNEFAIYDNGNDFSLVVNGYITNDIRFNTVGELIKNDYVTLGRTPCGTRTVRVSIPANVSNNGKVGSINFIIERSVGTYRNNKDSSFAVVLESAIKRRNKNKSNGCFILTNSSGNVSTFEKADTLVNYIIKNFPKASKDVNVIIRDLNYALKHNGKFYGYTVEYKK